MGSQAACFTRLKDINSADKPKEETFKNQRRVQVAHHQLVQNLATLQKYTYFAQLKKRRNKHPETMLLKNFDN